MLAREVASVERLRRLAPGILVAATGIGAGDLITASLAGAELGTAVLWAVLLGALFKWVLNEGLARWQMATGETLLEGWVTRLGSWIQWVFLAYLLLWSYTVAGALVSACGVAGDALWRLGGDPERSRMLWGVVHSLAGAALVLVGGFRLFETLMSLGVGLVFLTVLGTALTLGLAPGDLLRGMLVPTIPPGGLTWVLGLLGGVGGTLTLLSYGYWIREEGREGEQGLAWCREDLGVAYALTALFSLAMVSIGSRLPEIAGPKAQLAARLGDALGEALGPGGRAVFLVGFWAAVFSSLLGVWQGVPYLFADFLRLRRGQGEVGDLSRTLGYRAYLLGLALVPLANLGRPLKAVQLTYAVLGALFMPLLAGTLWVMNSREEWVGERFCSGPLVRVLLLAVLGFFGYAAWLQLAG